jgi:predicted nucleic acid-binding protein
MSVRTFVDTNVLVYLYDPAERAKRARARALIEAERRASPLLVSTQVLSELYAALTREKKGKPAIMPADRAERVVRALARWTVVVVDPATIVQAIALSRSARFAFWDALIVQSAIVGGCERLLSEDLGHGQRIGGVRIESPFLA